MTDDVIYKSQQIPSHYPAVRLELIRKRSPNWTFVKPKDKPDYKIKKDNSPGPLTYDTGKAKDKISSRSLNFMFSKTPKASITDETIKRAKRVPGAGHYDVRKSDKVVTLGARRGYK